MMNNINERMDARGTARTRTRASTSTNTKRTTTTTTTTTTLTTASIDKILNDRSVLSFIPSFSDPPAEFICPLSLSLTPSSFSSRLPRQRKTMHDPVVSLSTGITYERISIDTWRSEHGDVCPVTGQSLGLLEPNTQLKGRIVHWRQQIKGLRRIHRKSPTTFCLVDSSLTWCMYSSRPEINEHSNSTINDGTATSTTMTAAAPAATSNRDDSNISIDHGYNQYSGMGMNVSQESHEQSTPRIATAPKPPSKDTFDRIDELLSSFIEAGFSDYCYRVVARETNMKRRRSDACYGRRRRMRETTSASASTSTTATSDDTDDNDGGQSYNDSHVLDHVHNVHDATTINQIQYTYDTESYPSIFRRGPLFVRSRCDGSKR